MGPVPFTLSAEVSGGFKLPRSRLTFHEQVFPLENRVVGMSFAVFLNLFGAGILTLVVPSLTVSYFAPFSPELCPPQSRSRLSSSLRNRCALAAPPLAVK